MKRLFFVIFCFFLLIRPTVALIEVDITRGNLEPLPIAVSSFYHEQDSQEIIQGEKIIKNVGEETKTKTSSTPGVFELIA